MDSQRVRKPLRLTEYDYSVPGYYFVTLCTKNKEHLFWVPDVGATLGRPALSSLGTIVEEELFRIGQIYPNVVLDKYVIMPNHIHLILVIRPESTASGRPRVAPTLSTIIQQTKGRITKRAGFSLWQRSFYDHVIRGDDDYREIWHYIDSNPQKWQDDCYYTK